MQSCAVGSASCASLKMSGNAVSHRLQVSSNPGDSMISLQGSRSEEKNAEQHWAPGNESIRAGRSQAALGRVTELSTVKANITDSVYALCTHGVQMHRRASGYAS
jgi:hypothetical protein